MRVSEICSIVAANAFGSLLFWGFGMSLFGAIALGTLLCLVGFSVLNYLNHGTFRPFVSRSSAVR